MNLFNGENLLCAEKLEQRPTELNYKDNYGTIRHHFLDTRMKAKEQQTDIAIFCIENQDEVSNIMPVRDLGYLYSNYSEQLRRIRQENENKGYYSLTGVGDEQKLTPVISLILYYGSEKWDGPEKLSDMLTIPEKWRDRLSPWIAEHPIHVINLAKQEEALRAKYQSDFRHIVDFLACAGDRDKIKAYIQDKNRVIRHPEEYLDMMAVFSSKRGFSQIKENVLKKQDKRKGGDDMTAMDVVLDEIEKMGMEKGMAQGISQGISQGKREIICNLLTYGQPPEQISKYANEPVEYIYQIKKEMMESEPDGNE